MFKILLGIFLSLELFILSAYCGEIIIDLKGQEIVAGEIYNSEIYQDNLDNEIKAEEFLCPYLFVLSKDSIEKNENNYDKKTIRSRVIFTNEFDGKFDCVLNGIGVDIRGVKSFQKTEVENFSFYNVESQKRWIIYAVSIFCLMMLVAFLFFKRRSKLPTSKQFMIRNEKSREYFEEVYRNKKIVIEQHNNNDVFEFISKLEKVVFKKNWSEQEIEDLSKMNYKLSVRD